MPLIAIIAFVICVILFVLLSNILANRKQIKAAFEYGKTQFDIALPANAVINDRAFHKLSDEAAFFTLVIPYVESVPADKKKKMIEAIEALHSDLKINRTLYERFIDVSTKKDTP